MVWDILYALYIGNGRSFHQVIGSSFLGKGFHNNEMEFIFDRHNSELQFDKSNINKESNDGEFSEKFVSECV